MSTAHNMKLHVQNRPNSNQTIIRSRQNASLLLFIRYGLEPYKITQRLFKPAETSYEAESMNQGSFWCYSCPSFTNIIQYATAHINVTNNRTSHAVY